MTAPQLPLILALAFFLNSSSPGFAFQPSYLTRSARPSSALSSTAAATTAVDAATSSSGFWEWRGHDIFTEVRKQQNDYDSNEESSSDNICNVRPAVILLHGFGASTVYWRETMSVLHSEGYDVHALDLLGQGRSSKPFSAQAYPSSDLTDVEGVNGDSNAQRMEMGKNTNTIVEYSINLWANLVDDYARSHQLERVVLMGNSLGSLVALSAATGDFTYSETTYLSGENVDKSRVKGLCLFNCGVGLNSRNINKNPDFNSVQRVLINWLFDVFNALIFDNEFLLRYALNNIVTKEVLGDALKSLYVVSPERVDSDLVDSFYYPAKMGGNGAIEAIRQIYCNDAGLTPMEYHGKYPELLDALPVHLIWGLQDVVTPIEGDVGTFYCDRVANNRGGKGMTTIDCVRSGHIPFDDNPVESHELMMKWMAKRIAK
mmetsp:Transcript_87/g.189  ORF Transcript_87/g.189 Transcript_87/m.189 type:complete len:431 (+) Transcript_87:87-1379(+)